MFVLDTCLVSESVRKTPNTGVMQWIGTQRSEDLWLTTLTLGELVKGIQRLPSESKRSDLEHWYAQDLMARFRGRIQGLDDGVAFEWGRLCARLESAGTPMPAVDSQIAAVCLYLGATLVTRNVAEFRHAGVQVLNPWS